ncbi:phospholipase D-like domain-containing protein [Kribbella sp. NPDC051620]|uniref:phospholipase D-like domain-containing protein n=1 Tax=Kribbella sp. NPDC051620 TaxID=3364120 RepID=UPI00379F682A
MARVLAGENVWGELTPLLDHGEDRLAAAAYVTRADLLPLRRDDLLVVDAEPKTVATGGTDPAAIGELLDAGVDVRSFPGLHAKVFVTSRLAAIGSANASRAAVERLREAVVVTDDRRTRESLTEFIQDLHNNADEEISRLMLVESEAAAPPPPTARKALGAARRRARRSSLFPPRFYYEEFEWSGTGPLPEPGDLICQLSELDDNYELAAPQQVVDTITIPRSKRRWLLLLTDSTLDSLPYEPVRAAVGDGRKMPVGRWIKDPQVISEILRAWSLV